MSSNPFALLAADEPEDVPVKQVHHATKVQDAHSKKKDAPAAAAAAPAKTEEKKNNDRPKKREFDRHQSGTGRQGRGAFEKRGGGGKFNWGDDKTEAADAAAGNTNAGGETEGAADEDGKEKAPASSEPAVRDYESYLKQQAEQRAKVALPAARRPGEGEDQSKWGNTVAVKKDEGDLLVLAKKPTAEKKGDKKESKKQAVDLSLLNFRAANPDADRPPRERSDRPDRPDRGDRAPRRDDRAPRGDRPERGGDRKGAPAGAGAGSPAGPKGGNTPTGPRQGGRRDAPPNFQDASAFPTLG